MAKSKNKLQIYLVYALLAVFSLGHLPSLVFDLVGARINVALVDHPVLLLSLYGLTKLKSNKIILSIIVALTFSWLFSFSVFGSKIFLPGLLYLVRLISYLLFALVIKDLVQKKLINKRVLTKALLVVVIIVGIIGLSQYISAPDIRSLKLLGWDDHYYRLSFPFLDPAFTGIVLVLGILLALSIGKVKLAVIFLVVCLLLTYSRASFLSLIAGSLLLIPSSKFIKAGLVLALVFTMFVLLIPNVGGEGVNLLRTNSVDLKYQNTLQGLQLFKYSPVFGVGFNNVCIAKQQILGLQDLGLHSCSGLDNSPVFILATSGIIGFISFLALVFYIWKHSSKLMHASLVAVGVHGLFTNTYVYPWVLGWLGLIWALDFRQNTQP